MKYSFTRITGNGKTGPIPVTMTEKISCSPSCPFKANGCYAENFPLVLHWNRVSEKGIDFEQLTNQIKALPYGTFWRHNVAGDLDHEKGKIKIDKLGDLVKANRNRKGFTYTHHNLDLSHNAKAVRLANAQGFTINASCNSVFHAEQVREKHKVPTVCVVPKNETRKTWKTLKGTLVVTCPATYQENRSCDTCRLCQKTDRTCIVAFPAHGAGTKKIERVIQ